MREDEQSCSFTILHFAQILCVFCSHLMAFLFFLMADRNHTVSNCASISESEDSLSEFKMEEGKRQTTNKPCPPFCDHTSSLLTNYPFCPQDQLSVQERNKNTFFGSFCLFHAHYNMMNLYSSLPVIRCDPDKM